MLFYVALRPDCTVAEISDGISLSRRSVWGTLGDLRRAGMINVRREGRRHHYSVNYGAKVGLSVMQEGVELRLMLRFLANRTLRLLDEDEDEDPTASQREVPRVGATSEWPFPPTA